MDNNFYADIPLLPDSEIKAILSQGDAIQTSKLIISVALYHTDREYIESLSISLCDSDNEFVRGNAVLAFGHTARRFRALDEKALPLVKKALNDPSEYVRGQASAASDDIKFFLQWEI